MSPLERLQETIGTDIDNVFGPNTLRLAKEYYNLSNYQAAHFFGQIAHETGNFKTFEENLNYSAEGLLKTFPKYFNKNNVKEYERNPEKTANYVYGGRMGNNNEGDGWKYRGRGALQLTGKDNYKKYSKESGYDVILYPNFIANELAFDSALWFFTKKNLLYISDYGISEDTIKKVTKLINGGYNGLESRIEYTNKFYKFLINE